jgi:hypothetical protein
LERIANNTPLEHYERIANNIPLEHQERIVKNTPRAPRENHEEHMQEDQERTVKNTHTKRRPLQHLQLTNNMELLSM